MSVTSKAIRRRLEPVRCVGCGSSLTSAQLIREKRSHPGMLSCCPERKPLTIDQWRARANEFEVVLRRAGWPFNTPRLE